jgi:peptidoglycan/LPS O-acetylase OafA/YrhL
MPGFLSNSVGAWSLGIELAFYAVFPVIAMLARSWRTVAVSAAVLIAGQHLLLWKIATVPVFWDYYLSNLIFAPFFALGILA